MNYWFKFSKNNLFNNRGGVIDKGSVYVVIILTLLIFGAYIFVGGTLPAKLPKVSNELVTLNNIISEPTKAGLQLYTFSGSLISPRQQPTLIPTKANAPKLTDCYRDISGNQEAYMIWGFSYDSSPASENQPALKVFYTNKNALIIGSGTISQMINHPADYIANPNIGNTAIKDINKFPFYPTVFFTDITTIVGDASGDAQAGGLPNKPDGVYGTWKALGAIDPVQNKQILGSIADPWPPVNGPPGTHDLNFGAEIIFKISNLKAKDPQSGQFVQLLPGHKYRGQIALHDGGEPTDIGVACIQLNLPNS